MEIIESAKAKTLNIKSASLSIYDPIEVGDKNFWLTSDELSVVLNQELTGKSFEGLALKTRSKVAKELVCKALGYPLPKSFKKCQPRFFGQCFDTYVQKSNNVQVWNEDLDVERRYVIIRTDENDIITKVKVISGSDLAKLDTTGKLTQKFQATLAQGDEKFELISNQDTIGIKGLTTNNVSGLSQCCPVSQPNSRQLMTINDCFEKLKTIVGQSFVDAGIDQERNRGAGLHALVCEALGYSDYKDNGKFPDIKQQLLEVKLQTSNTIDLGLVCPNSDAHLDMEKIDNYQVRHSDVRYAIFYGYIESGLVHITNLYLTTGADFFTRFVQIGGKVLNKKIQITLPRDFFN